MQRARHLLRSSVIVIILFGLGKLTGLIRVRLVAQAFGTGPDLDAFTAANQLPEVFFVLIAGGSLAAAFIPVYSQYLTQESRRDSMSLANTVLTLVLLILGTISALGAIFAPWLSSTLLVPDFSPAQQMLTAQIMRIILIQTTIFGIGGVLSSILNAHQHFALPALAPIALDVGYFLGLWLLVPTMGIIGLAWGTVIGGLLYVAIQLPALRHFSVRLRLAFQVRLAGVREIIHLMGPRIVTLGAIQIADLVTIRLASGLAAGATSGYFLAYSLMQLPQTLFGTAIALVVFPTFAELYNAGDIEGLKRLARRTLGIIWTLTIPAAAITILLGRPLIVLLFQGGEFDEASTALVYGILVIFSLRIVSESTLEIVARLFYAQHNTATPMYAYLGWLLVTALLAYLLVLPMGIAGLALATTITFTLLAAVLFILNGRALAGLGDRELWLALARAVVATAVMSAVIVLVTRFVPGTLMAVLVGGGIGAIMYVLVNQLLGGRELKGLWSLVRPRAEASPSQ